MDAKMREAMEAGKRAIESMRLAEQEAKQAGCVGLAGQIEDLAIQMAQAIQEDFAEFFGDAASFLDWLKD